MSSKYSRTIASVSPAASTSERTTSSLVAITPYEVSATGTAATPETLSTAAKTLDIISQGSYLTNERRSATSMTVVIQKTAEAALRGLF